MEWENDFYESERDNAINRAKSYFKIPSGHALIEDPIPHCAINHDSINHITARVFLSHQNLKTGSILTKIINLEFHDNGVQTSWGYKGSDNG